jgi:N-acetylglucosaminyldiphosphoundecaprenol N-acetyl-beta-D-mannosaminyltransferase
MLQSYQLYSRELSELPEGRLLITTINAHSYNVAQQDTEFAEALRQSDVLLPDGISIVLAKRMLTPKPPKGELRKKIKKIAGEDLFYWEMRRMNKMPPNQTSPQPSPRGEGERKGEQKTASVLFLGSSEEVLAKIKARAANDFPNVEVHTYSPPYKPEFSAEDNRAMLEVINKVNPDVLFVGMTAPKQEKWAYKLVESSQLIVDSEEKKKVDSGQFKVERQIVDNLQLKVESEMQNTQYSELSTIHYPQSTNCQLSIVHCPLTENCHVCCIGAVFDFYAETVKRAPQWIINIGLEWLYRLVSEPKRMWRRYLIGNVKFIGYVIKEIFEDLRI